MPEGSESHPNGKDPATEIERNYAEKIARRARYEAESESQRHSFAQQILQLMDDRQTAMAEASKHAGNIGLLYHARSNSFSRVIVVDDVSALSFERPEHPDAVPTTAINESPPNSAEQDDTSDIQPLPAASSPKVTDPTTLVRPVLSAVQDSTADKTNTVPEVPAPPRLPNYPSAPARPSLANVHDKWDRSTAVKSVVAWVASLFIGVFVGFGLLTLTGLAWQRPSDRMFLYVFLLLGVAAIAGMKLLFDAMWFETGRRRVLGTSSLATSLFFSVVSLLILGVEACLGGQALVIYTRRASFDNAGELPFLQAVLLATAVSSANLLFSAFIGYQKGQRSVTADDIVRQEYDRQLDDHRRQVALLEETYRLQLSNWQEDSRRHESLKQLHHERELEAIDRAHEEARRAEEIRIRLHQLRVDALEDRRNAHEEAVSRWRSQMESVTQSHGDGVANRLVHLDEYESYGKLPDFQALCKYVGLIETLSIRIEELKRMSDNNAISRGHARKAAIN